MENSDDFTYPDGSELSMVAEMTNDDINVNWSVNPHDYEFNGSITAQLMIDDKEVDSGNYILAAFEGDQCIGSTQAYKFPLNDSYVFGLMIYNNKETANISFKVYDQDNNQYIDLNESMAYYSDMHLGDGLNPVTLNSQTELPEQFLISNAYPNPFNPTVNFDVELNHQTFISVSIYNINGQRISEVYSGYLNAGLNKMSWDAENYASGVYFLNVESKGQLLSTQKISLLK